MFLSLGFDTLGRLALGQIQQGGISLITLTAQAGAHTITGNAIVLRGSLAVSSGSYVIAGSAVSFATKLTANAGTYSVAGNATVFPTQFASGSGAYAVTGSAVAFKSNMAEAGGVYSLTGNATSERVALQAVSGSYAIIGGSALEPIVMRVDPGSYLLTLGDFVLTRTGGEFDQVYGGIGHYLEELERQKQLARITRPTPRPIMREIRPKFRQVQVFRPQEQAPPAIDFQAIMAQRQAEQAAQQAALKKRRQDEEIAILARIVIPDSFGGLLHFASRLTARDAIQGGEALILDFPGTPALTVVRGTTVWRELP